MVLIEAKFMLLLVVAHRLVSLCAICLSSTYYQHDRRSPAVTIPQPQLLSRPKARLMGRSSELRDLQRDVMDSSKVASLEHSMDLPAAEITWHGEAGFSSSALAELRSNDSVSEPVSNSQPFFVSNADTWSPSFAAAVPNVQLRARGEGDQNIAALRYPFSVSVPLVPRQAAATAARELLSRPPRPPPQPSTISSPRVKNPALTSTYRASSEPRSRSVRAQMVLRSDVIVNAASRESAAKQEKRSVSFQVGVANEMSMDKKGNNSLLVVETSTRPLPDVAEIILLHFVIGVLVTTYLGKTLYNLLSEWWAQMLLELPNHRHLFPPPPGDWSSEMSELMQQVRLALRPAGDAGSTNRDIVNAGKGMGSVGSGLWGQVTLPQFDISSSGVMIENWIQGFFQPPHSPQLLPPSPAAPALASDSFGEKEMKPPRRTYPVGLPTDDIKQRLASRTPVRSDAAVSVERSAAVINETSSCVKKMMFSYEESSEAEVGRRHSMGGNTIERKGAYAIGLSSHEIQQRLTRAQRSGSAVVLPDVPAMVSLSSTIRTVSSTTHAAAHSPASHSISDSVEVASDAQSTAAVAVAAGKSGGAAVAAVAVSTPARPLINTSSYSLKKAGYWISANHREHRRNADATVQQTAAQKVQQAHSDVLLGKQEDKKGKSLRQVSGHVSGQGQTRRRAQLQLSAKNPAPRTDQRPR